MDAMKPQLYWVGDRCYRKNPIVYRVGAARRDEGECQVDPMPEDPCDLDGVNVVEGSRGYTASLDVASAYHRFIIGSRNETRRRLEMETSTKVEVPKPEQAGFIVISGNDRAGVVSCVRRIQLLVNSARLKQPFTHFISIPFTSEEIQSNFLKFKEAVLKLYSGFGGISESVFQKPERLHMTIGVLVLMSESERRKAKELLEKCREEVILPLLGKELKDIQCNLTGVDCMNDDPSAVTVLHAKVVFPSNEELEKFQNLINQVYDFFGNSGLLLKQHEKVKMHVTVMNDTFRRAEAPENDSADATQGRRSVRQTFNVRKILDVSGLFKCLLGSRGSIKMRADNCGPTIAAR